MPDSGQGRIADYPRRFHQASIARSSVHRTLGKHGLNRLPANQKPSAAPQMLETVQEAAGGHRLQLDVKQLLNWHGVSDDIHLFNQKLREWEDYYIVRTGRSTGKPRMNGFSQRSELRCHWGPESLQ